MSHVTPHVYPWYTRCTPYVTHIEEQCHNVYHIREKKKSEKTRLSNVSSSGQHTSLCMTPWEVMHSEVS